MQEVLALLADYGYESIEEVETAKEDILFSLPKELRAALKNDENGGRQARAAAGQNRPARVHQPTRVPGTLPS